jgi:transcriptional regulator with XRE-family HTH domain
MEQETGPVDETGLDYSDAAATFGDRLALAREAAGLSQVQLAHKLGVRVQTLRNWEDDRSEPRANRLQMLAGMLGVSLVWLMSGSGHPPVPAAAPRAAVGIAACLGEIRALGDEQARLAERLGRVERRLRAMLG